MSGNPASPILQFALELRVTIAPTIELGEGPLGMRRTVPITGGTFEGPALRGRVLSGGADWQYVTSDGLTFVDARYVIETADGVRIEVRNQGVRHGPREVLDRIAAGEAVPPDAYYFRATPRFFAPAGDYEWLNRAVFVASGERFAELVVVRVWQVL
jgi:Protein of unknown function (DUF3237)